MDDTVMAVNNCLSEAILLDIMLLFLSDIYME